MSARLISKIHLSAEALLSKARHFFENVQEPEKGSQGPLQKISIEDCLMSALALFKLKLPSLLQFEEQRIEEPLGENLKNLFQIQQVPCDTYMRERLDLINPQELRLLFKSIFTSLQRGKILERYVFLEGKYLLLSDATGFFSSKSIHCKNCCQKTHRKDGSITYYHQMLSGAIVHPDHKEVIPLCPEPIMQKDGFTKNDCERNASERFLNDFRREHPHLPIILVEDALASNGPHLKLLKSLDINFITVVKALGNKSLFDWINGLDNIKDAYNRYDFIDDSGSQHYFKYINKLPINDSHADLEINFLEYRVTDKQGKQTYYNTWVTDIMLTQENVHAIARGGRARWLIENEVFNTLKNQGYHFEHNFGHGYKNLSTIFAMLMLLAFFIDQTEQMACGLFQGALQHFKGRKSYLFRCIRGYFSYYIIRSWEAIYRNIMGIINKEIPILDSS